VDLFSFSALLAFQLFTRKHWLQIFTRKHWLQIFTRKHWLQISGVRTRDVTWNRFPTVKNF